MVEIGLSMGSNLGDRLRNLRRARGEMAASDGVTLLASSRLYETEPVDVLPENMGLRYLNAVVVIGTDRSPAAIAERAHEIEAEMGRERTVDRNAPRPLDIDLIYAGAMRVHTGALTLPHPRWQERRFVVQPLADVRPDLVVPGQSRPVRGVLASLPERPGVELFASEW
jgi:2-amino-4-hydroxy-6-hydroxymethyldihydropteridine diphosphokinase